MYVSLFLFLDYITLVYKRQHPSFFFSVLYSFSHLFCLLFTIYADFSADYAFPSCCIQVNIFQHFIPCFIFLCRVPRILCFEGIFYQNPSGFFILSCTIFHPARRNSVPVFSRSYVRICKVHVPVSGKIDCNLFQWDLY